MFYIIRINHNYNSYIFIQLCVLTHVVVRMKRELYTTFCIDRKYSRMVCLTSGYDTTEELTRFSILL